MQKGIDLASEQKPQQQPRWIKKLVVISIILGLLMTLLPYAIQYGITEGLKSQDIKTASIEDVDFNLFTGELAIKKLHAQRVNQPDISINLLKLAFDWMPLFKKNLFISSLSISDTTITVHQPDETHIFIGGIKIPLSQNDTEQKSESSSDWGIGLDKLVLTNNIIQIDTPNFAHDFSISALSLNDVFSWKPEHSSDITLDTMLNGASIKGDIKFTAFDETPTVKGSLVINNFALSTLKPFVAQHLSTLEGDLNTDLTFSLTVNNNSLEYQQNGQFSIKESAVGLPDIKLQHANIGWGGSIKVKQIAEAMTIDLQGELSADQHQNNLTSPNLHTSIDTFRWKGTTQIKMSEEQPSIKASGLIDIQGITSKNIDTKLIVTALKHLSVGQLVINELDSIKLNTVTLSDLLLAQKQESESLFQSKQTTFDSLHIANLKTISMSKTVLDSISSSININKQGQLTLLDSLTDSLKTNSKKNHEPTTETEPTNFSIKGIELTGNNRINFAKAAQKGSVKKTILINTLNIGEIDTQKTEQYTPIALKATIDKHSSIKTDGKIALFSKTTNAEFKSTLNAFELPDYSPIISDQIGYDIQTGQLNASANLNIKQDMLDGKTDLEINQLALVTSDAKTASKMTQQLSMPLDSALSLLRDDNDDIALSIPIKGNITSPDFNISDVINTALGNALQGTVKNYLKYALQPYGLIFMAAEKAYGAATAIKLDAISFEPAQSTLPANSAPYFEKIGTMLQKRPGLRIKLCGFSTELDRLTLNTLADPQKPSKEKQTTVNDKQLIALAKDRAQAVKSHFIQQYKVDAKRLFSCTPTIDIATEKTPPRVELSI